MRRESSSGQTWCCNHSNTIKKSITLALLVFGSYGCSQNSSDEVSAYLHEDELPSIYLYNDTFLTAPIRRYLNDELETQLWNHHFFGLSPFTLRIHEEGWARGVKKESARMEQMSISDYVATLRARDHTFCLLTDRYINTLSEHIDNPLSVDTWNHELYAAWHEYGHCVVDAATYNERGSVATDDAAIYKREVFADIYALLMMQKLSNVDGHSALKAFRDENLHKKSDVIHWSSPVLDTWRDETAEKQDALDEQALFAWLKERDVYTEMKQAKRQLGP